MAIILYFSLANRPGVFAFVPEDLDFYTVDPCRLLVIDVIGFFE